jgi:hypothetical protein
MTSGVPAGVVGDCVEVHRLCVFDLDLSCGHRLTVMLNGWHPVTVACCDRLGGHWLGGEYCPFASHVEYARCLRERYEQRPKGAAREPLKVIERSDRTDDPLLPTQRWQQPSGGRFPVRVGAPFNSPRTAADAPAPPGPAAD